MNKITPLLVVLSTITLCSCASNINKEKYNSNIISNNVEELDNKPIYKQELNDGKVEVYIFTSYTSSGGGYYHLLTTYDAPLTLESYNTYFTINKDNVTTYYSIPMFQYTFSV